MAQGDTHSAPQERHPAPRAWRLAVIGAALGSRLHRPALLRRLGRPVQLQVAARSRARFEAALEQIALHEGVLLPPTA